MSLTTQDEVKCSCGHAFEVEVYQSVSVHEHPDLKEQILGGEFNVVCCPFCKQFLHVDRFVLYHDRDQELLAFVYPKLQEPNRSTIEQTMAMTYQDLQSHLEEQDRLNYLPFLVFGLDQLCDLIHLEEQISDEAEICRNHCDTLGLSYKTIHRDVARRKNIMPILPVAQDSELIQTQSGAESQSREQNQQQNFRARVLAGLEDIFEINPHFKHYFEFYKQVKENSQWTVNHSEFIEIDS